MLLVDHIAILQIHLNSKAQSNVYGKRTTGSQRPSQPIRVGIDTDPDGVALECL